MPAPLKRLRGTYHAALPHRVTYQRRGGRVHWFLLTVLDDCLATGDEKTRTAAMRAAYDRRRELLAELRATAERRPDPPVPLHDRAPSCIRRRIVL